VRLQRIVPAVLVLIAAGIVSGLCFSSRLSIREGAPEPENIIRLHVIANSDTEADQALKLAVRDAILAEMTPLFRQAADVDTARRLVRENLGRLEDIARQVMRQYMADYPVQASLGRFAFPTRVYGALVLPAGNYEALRVTLGAGKGRNWWCVLFPPLCFLDGTAEAAAGAGEAAAPAVLLAEPDPTEIEVRFKLVEIWQKSVDGWQQWQEKLAGVDVAGPVGIVGEKPVTE